ncbi:hypothetical protein SAMN04488096_101193 [Mesonia phycicola]|uniref:Uncharacterized protein n=1 Tax=Mesonia phycicola TaxID=579105 RepID=A0A1M6ABT7_9FLAO|nr:hypothetical protein SAMN04488096_101193 [Mesonia phycicola]
MKKIILLSTVLFTTTLIAKEGMYLYSSNQKVESKTTKQPVQKKVKGCYIY